MYGKRRILAIEDEKINLGILTAILEDQYEVIPAMTGAEAMAAIDANRETLSLILLDLNLPDVHGMDILRQVRSDPELNRIPVIVMTADTESEVESLAFGAIDFIPKPYPSPKVILARVLRTIELCEDRDLIRSTERDELTGLYNWEYFHRYAGRYDQYDPNRAMDALVVDINHFHTLNERFGRGFGDEVLRSVGQKLRETFSGESGLVCRREADTFFVYCSGGRDYPEVLNGLSEGLDSRIRLRMGVYPEADKAIDLERRMDRAKMAANTVRGSFTRSVGLYDQKMHEQELFAEQLLDEFPAAIADGQFRVFFQPKFNIRGEEPVLCSAEALVRWQHPRLGMVGPGVFIPLFEENGLICQLDHYVWRETARQIREWKDRLGIAVPVSVNVSRVDTVDTNLVKDLKSLVGEFGLSPEELLLEITESAYTRDSGRVIGMVNDLRATGFRIEMDDFGSGYSSLNMISELPVDAIKLDMMFIRNAFGEGKNTRIISVVLDIAAMLGVPTIAEGVETAEQLNALREMGCDIVQGYYFSRPVPAPEFEPFLMARKEMSGRTGE